MGAARVWNLLGVRLAAPPCSEIHAWPLNLTIFYIIVLNLNFIFEGSRKVITAG